MPTAVTGGAGTAALATVSAALAVATHRPPVTPPAIKWNATQARMCQVSQCGRFAVRETTDGGLFFGIDYGDLTKQSPVFQTIFDARQWCQEQVTRGQSVNGEEWPAEELPRW